MNSTEENGRVASRVDAFTARRGVPAPWARPRKKEWRRARATPLGWIAVLWLLAVAGAHSPAGAALLSEPSATALSSGTPEGAPARGKFLVASRELAGPTFARRVVLLLDYDEGRGGLGLVINRHSGIPLSRVVPGLEKLVGRDDYIRSGGPVERNRLFMLMRADSRPPGTEQILEDTYGSSTLNPLRALLASDEAESAVFVVYAGYAGWEPGQLEAEIERGDWYVAPGRSELVFDADPAEVWPQLIRFHGGKWVKGLLPSSGLARTGPCSRWKCERWPTAARIRPCPERREGASFRSARRNCAGAHAARAGEETRTAQGLKLSNSLSLLGPVTTLQYQSPSWAAFLPGT